MSYSRTPSKYRHIKGAVRPIYAWDDGVHFDDNTYAQARATADLPFIHKHVALMPDAHVGIGATVGSVVPTKNAIIPAAVGVDIGCGMMAVSLSLNARDLPDNLRNLRLDIETHVPVGFQSHKNSPRAHRHNWNELFEFQSPEVTNRANREFVEWLKAKHPKIGERRKDSIEEIIVSQYGTLGGGNHFIEICLDTNDDVWVLLHSGSRGIGNILGQYFIEYAKKDMRRYHINLPDVNLSYLPEGTKGFGDYWKVLTWAQEYARKNRERMMDIIIKDVLPHHLPEFTLLDYAVNCHHNYAALENHYGENVYVTRKGAVRARKNDMGIIPGSMGDRSYIVRGKGSRESFHSCSHGAGRLMSRTKARNTFTVADHREQTEGVECRNDSSVLDEIPGAYKPIDSVMQAQSDLVEVVTELRQVVNVKG